MTLDVRCELHSAAARGGRSAAAKAARPTIVLCLPLLICLAGHGDAQSQETTPPHRHDSQHAHPHHHTAQGSAAASGEGTAASPTRSRSQRPSPNAVTRALLLRDYNTRMVALGTFLFGCCAGVVGTFMLLRKRPLVGDVVSHASLPGIALAFIVLQGFAPQQSRSLLLLSVGAFLAGLISIFCVTAIRRLSKVKDDAALAIVLSVFFGLGVVLFTIVQKLPSGSQAGLHEFILGKAGAIIADDVLWIGTSALAAMAVCALLFKELGLICFDARFAESEGWPVVAIDLLLLALVVCVTVIGMRSVGLLLIVAMLVIPPAAARFWTDHLLSTTLLSALLGGVSAYTGVMFSAIVPRLATGAVIVLAAAAVFLVSLLIGTKRGALKRHLSQRRSRRRVARQHLLRAVFEILEPDVPGGAPGHDWLGQIVPLERLLAKRSWTEKQLGQRVRHLEREGLVKWDTPDAIRLTPTGQQAAWRMTRNHRLWELYLIHHADVAPSHVDRDADRIEHILDSSMIEELESMLGSRRPALPSPHREFDLQS